MGSYKGLKEVRRVVEDCMMNIHPIYHIKELMIKRELAKDPELAHENWDRFLPHFKKRSLNKRRKPFRVTDKSKKVYTPFPPPQEKSKVDLQIESGEYFLARHAKDRMAREKREEKQREKKRERDKERDREFVPPKEKGDEKGKKKKEKKRKRVDMDGDVYGDGEVEQANGVEPRKEKKKKRRAKDDEEGINGVGGHHDEEQDERDHKRKKRRRDINDHVDL